MMKLECPWCKGSDLYEIDQVSFEDRESSNGVNMLALAAHYGPTGEMGWTGEKRERVAVRASARVCATCGHADLFTRDLELLGKLASEGAAGVRKVR
jgi:hypothetical protein